MFVKSNESEESVLVLELHAERESKRTIAIEKIVSKRFLSLMGNGCTAQLSIQGWFYSEITGSAYRR
jgi:hypothetical protein